MRLIFWIWNSFGRCSVTCIGGLFDALLPLLNFFRCFSDKNICFLSIAVDNFIFMGRFYFTLFTNIGLCGNLWMSIMFIPVLVGSI